MRAFLTFLFFSITFATHGQALTPSELLSRSIAFHDPMDKWQNAELELVIRMELPAGPPRVSKVQLNNANGHFSVSYVSKGHLLEYRINELDSAEVYADFQLATGRTDIDSLDLSKARARRWRDYYGYLYGLPMKLKDEGTILSEEVAETYFDGKQVLALRVTYDESVGKDTWYFYFHPETYAMVGYRFYHDEEQNDGEYIVLDGVRVQNGLRIPEHRYWYVNENGRFLGADMMMALQVR